jgi:hypothetical protein
MPVDRTRRDAAAQVLADYLRGELDHRQLFARFGELEAAPAESKVSDKFLDVLLHEGPHVACRCKDHGDSISNEMWPFVLRTLAFLKSNCEEEEEPVVATEGQSRQTLEARWHAVALLLILVPSYLVSWWIGVFAVLCSFLVFQFCEHRRDKAWSNKIKERAEYDPFPSLKDWKDHEALLEPFRIPAYEVSRFHPARRGPLKRALHSMKRGVTTAVIFTAMGCAFAFSIVIWPLWIILASLSRRKAVS